MDFTSVLTLVGELREFENKTLEKVESEKLSEALVRIKMFQDEMEIYEKRMKKELLSRGETEAHMFPLFEKKLTFNPGKSKIEYDNLKIYNDMNDEGHRKSFFKIVKVQKKLVKDLGDGEVSAIVDKHSISDIGDTYISISRMTKDEIAGV